MRLDEDQEIDHEFRFGFIEISVSVGGLRGKGIQEVRWEENERLGKELEYQKCL